MRLYFLRHATASDTAKSDAARKLTQTGRKEAQIAGIALRKMRVQLYHILSSPLVRARETAAIAAKALKFAGEVEVVAELTNESTTAALLRTLQNHTTDREILLVGHSPSLPQHISALIGAKNLNGLALGKGGIACLEMEDLRPGAGQLRWLLRQGQLKLIVP